MSPAHNEGFHQAALEQREGLYRFAMALTRDPSAAEDLLHDTYLRAALAERRPQPGNRLKAWLLLIMRHLWYNEVRHRRNGPKFIGFDATETLAANDASSDPQLVCARLSELEAVRAAIERMPALYREVVVLRYIEGFRYKEMAEIMACPVGTVMSRLARARERLKQSLAEPEKIVVLTDPPKSDHRTIRME